MNLTELTTAIRTIIQDSSYDSELTARINEAVTAVAYGDFLPGRVERTSPLPDLYATDTVTATISSSKVALPENFQRNCFLVLNSDGEEIKLMSGFNAFQRTYPKQVSGGIYRCCVNGSYLHYRDLADATLTVHYYKSPTDLSVSAPTLTCIPAHLHRKLIVSHVCKSIFDEIEDGIEGQKVNTNHYEGVYLAGLLELQEWIGEEKEAEFYNLDYDGDRIDCDYVD
ncbi:hypothetical protein [Desulfobacter postgatei]|uniref:phage adaptor protein n=1 Tax=Desulfobacter postgatei TaxID=2293 RepID=UPI00259BF041|nr:hypothetical protein [uncultured Desulfobacter sp.]